MGLKPAQLAILEHCTSILNMCVSSQLIVGHDILQGEITDNSAKENLAFCRMSIIFHRLGYDVCVWDVEGVTYSVISHDLSCCRWVLFGLFWSG